MAVAGSIAGTPAKRSGHIQIKLFGISYLAHRLAWKMYYGSDPEFEIDHRDCVGGNNRIVNLREADRRQNCMNRRHRKTSTSPYKGVKYHAEWKKWQARIQVDGRRMSLGLFGTAEQAKAAYDTAAAKYFGSYWRAA